MSEFYVKAFWDAEAKVFYSDTDIPGLTVEAATVEEFQSLVADLAPDMLADNLGIHDAHVVVHVTTDRALELAVA